MYIGTFACCNGDSWASELGTVVGNGSPYLVTTFKKVPRGKLQHYCKHSVARNYLGCLAQPHQHVYICVYKCI